MIYYPRPEHAIINYDNKITHHAIAIPKGEGRYIMNRLTGEIKTIKGPAMDLPDPRTEIVVKRKLTPKQCDLWFPGNKTVYEYNQSLTEKAVEKSLGGRSNATKAVSVDALTASSYSTSIEGTCSTAYASALDSNTIYATNSLSSTLANLESNASISRGTSYSKPRTITFEDNYDGVVAINVWTGYAVNVISKSGDRKVVCGPQTVLLDYDQTLEEINMSTGKPKTTDKLIKTVYLRHENNKISDIISVETKDFVNCDIKVSYCVDFDMNHTDKWFSVENYVKFLCDRIRSDLKREVKKYNIEDFFQNYSNVVRDTALGADSNGRFFNENGMRLKDCEVLNLNVESGVEDRLMEHQAQILENHLKIVEAENKATLIEKLSAAETKEQELRNKQLMNKMELQRMEAERKLDIENEIKRKKEAEAYASKQAEADMNVLVDAIHSASLARKEKDREAEIAYQRSLAEIEESRMNAYAATISNVLKDISPDLVAAMNSKSNADMTVAIAEALAPYAIARDESVGDVVNKLLRGTALEQFVGGVNLNLENK
jgi:major vault protein